MDLTTSLIRRSEQVSLNLFFQKGFYLDRLPDGLSQEILKIVRSTTYIKSEDYRDVGYKPPLIAEWDDVNGPIVSAHNCDLKLRPYWNTLREYIRPIEQLYGNFDSGSVLINKFPQGHGMNWHSDTVDTTFIQLLLYLTEDTFSQKDGGYLQVATGNVSNYGVIENPKHQEDILPNHGTIVVMNNLAPTMVHRVDPLVSLKERYTVVFRYGFLHNTMTLKRHRLMKGNLNGV